MYRAGYYNDVKRLEAISFMKESPFAIVTGFGEKYPVATRLPLDIVFENDRLSITGHMMRKTDHMIAFEKNNNALLVFHSPEAYINAGWYVNPHSGSTVNYISVHVTGKIIFKDAAGTKDEVRKATEKYIGPDSLASFDKLSDEYIATMVKAISGFSIEVEKIEAVFKLSQNKSVADQERIIAQLSTRGLQGDIYIANKMKQNLADAQE